jgi:hypothetical protein
VFYFHIASLIYPARKSWAKGGGRVGRGITIKYKSLKFFQNVSAMAGPGWPFFASLSVHITSWDQHIILFP